MDLCVLPQTGANEQWLVLAVVAFVVIGAGVALALSGKARRRVATGLGALAIVGALAIGGVHAAPAAQADAGASDCITPGGAAPAVDTVVTPQIPTASQQCLAEPTITVPSQPGVDFTSAREGDILTLTAAAQPGYRILEGATTSWQYVMTPPTPAVSPVALPAGVTALEDVTTDEANRFAPVDSTLIPDLVAAQTAGQLTYALHADNAAYAITIDFVDAVTGEARPSETFSDALPGSILQYDGLLDLYLFSTTLTQAEQDAIVDGLVDQAIASLTSDPTRTPTTVTERIAGLSVGVAWGQDTVCGTQLGNVPVDAIRAVIPLTPPVPGNAGAAAPSDQYNAALAETQQVEAPAAAAPAAAAPAAEETEVVETEVVETEVPVEIEEPEASEVPEVVEG